MERQKTDLRIIKTKQNIKQTFLEIMKKKPVEKITVTEIAAKALINKGTFYLHYQDVYALYDEIMTDAVCEFCNSIDFYNDFFDAPTVFTEKILNAIKNYPFEKEFTQREKVLNSPPLPMRITEELIKHIYNLNRIKHTINNDIRLEYILSGIFITVFKYGESNYNEMLTVISATIETLNSKYDE